MNDPEQFEKEAFIDRLKETKFAIKEFRKLHEKAPVTDYMFRAKILKEIERSKSTLSKIQADYEMFKKYKTRTAISK
jgi:chaperonin cofactor prefoldin